MHGGLKRKDVRYDLDVWIAELPTSSLSLLPLKQATMKGSSREGGGFELECS